MYAQHFGIIPSTICEAFKRLQITRKKALLYKERSEDQRRVFLDEIKSYPKESLIFVDESCIDSYVYRAYGKEEVQIQWEKPPYL